MQLPESWRPDMITSVQQALAEDIGDGDITAELIPATQIMRARIITRDDATICGRDWVNEVFHQLDDNVKVTWHCGDGDRVSANDVLFELEGSARSLMTGERTALNFLQLLSGVASKAWNYAQRVKHTNVTLLDTRKTIPGIRTGQKYAVTCGGCANHRIGLYDAFLIKENHISACGGIENAIQQAKANHPGKPIEIEVENLTEFDLALEQGADIIMLDNFSNTDKVDAVARANGRAKLEASGGITDATLVDVAQTGVDFISLGTLTKDVVAVDLSMRIVD
ncbi:Nicotinate-nucleotide pyrophosphorylase [carboxylating] [BD1-7 clade bacterium]|uniref:Probable nicotinate-nucleotide pyrophosphorylase [carboxylating] n=1 Tax=BD1-7 clade bacterium TaxID=2029982 RepID=A0A5S9QBQ8_9GAMM|nr:Nicotinate-nucleotide pyrophosphorylase [carboxylating] [BD1-7 clade bacterium]CAA0115668.1 Nicotinate-nucleotide pyrophosphorylase [carboxylating] [BD1-7 clade bacterium]